MNNHHLALAIMPFTLAAAPVAAQQTGGEENMAPATSTSKAQPLAAEGQSESPMLSMNELDEMRGGTQIAINNQLLNAENTGNTINGDFTAGDVSLADNAFSNFSGLGNFVFNTGAQSSLQAGMSITINVEN